MINLFPAWPTRRDIVAATAAVAIWLVPCTSLAEQLAGSEWKPTQLYDKSVPADFDIFIQFGGEDRATGYGGCNRFTGRYSTDEQTIRIGPLASTRRACVPEVMDMENLFFKVLDSARSFQRNRIDLILFDDAQVEIARLRQTDAD